MPHRLIEKKRRDRINECIAQLKDLLPEHLKLTVGPAGRPRAPRRGWGQGAGADGRRRLRCRRGRGFAESQDALPAVPAGIWGCWGVLGGFSPFFCFLFFVSPSCVPVVAAHPRRAGSASQTFLGARSSSGFLSCGVPARLAGPPLSLLHIHPPALRSRRQQNR